jgi:hypothetical protein
LTTAKAYLNKAQGRQNLNIVTKAFVSRVIKMNNKNNLILYINACTYTFIAILNTILFYIFTLPMKKIFGYQYNSHVTNIRIAYS